MWTDPDNHPWHRLARAPALGVALGVGICATATNAFAYIGPGAGFAIVSSFLTLFVAFVAAFFALITFPVRAVIGFFRHRRSRGKARAKKVIILGLDGLEPTIAERMMDQGELPNLARLRQEGSYRRLATATPALSPVAWSTFATGTDSSRHAIWDFLARDRRSYLPRLSSSEVYSSTRFLRIGRWAIPLGGRTGIRKMQRSKTFWRVLSEHGIWSSVLRVPITFPVEKIHGVMVAGMCAPDLRGTQGSFTLFTTGSEAEHIGGLVVPFTARDGTYHADIPGPSSPVDGSTMTLPLRVRVLPDSTSRVARNNERNARIEGQGARNPGHGALEVNVAGQTLVVAHHEYTPWVHLKFRAAPGATMHGIVRFYPTRTADGVGLYMTPIHIDPAHPALPISYPSFYSMYLSKLIGPHATLGLAEDTWAMNEGVLDEQGWLDQAWSFHEERRKMWFHSLDHLREGMAVVVFDITDRLQHMFFRWIDDNHPAVRGMERSPCADAIPEMYREMDKLVGDTQRYVDDDTAFFVISDHGFKPFRRGIDLNAWLVESGFMTLKEGAGPGEYLSSVDWSRTQAFALGLGNIYINIKGRERQGIVEPGDVAAVTERVAQRLSVLCDTDGTRAVHRVIDVQRDFDGPYRNDGPELIPGFAIGYRESWDCAKGVVTGEVFHDNTRAWSGDHCMDPELVPGVLFTNTPVAHPAPRLMDMGPTVLELFGVPAPPYMTGRNICE